MQEQRHSSPNSDSEQKFGRQGGSGPSPWPSRAVGRGAQPIPPKLIQEQQTRKAELRAKRRRIAYRAVIVLLVVILSALVAVAVWWKDFINKPALPDPSVRPETSNQTDTSDSPFRMGGDRKKDFFTFLVIGRDTGGGGNTDTILLASYDVPNQELNVMSIPRDTMVNVSWEIKKINSVYPIYGGGDKGIDALDKEISQLVGFVPDFQVVLEWKAVGELVDALGGITFDVPVNMRYTDPTQNLYINVKKGEQLLNGDLAMQVVRFRSYPDGDLGRVKVQQDFLKAVVKKCLRLENMTKVTQLAKVFTQNVKTNLKVEEIAWFADKAIFSGLKMENVHFMTMPNQLASLWSPTYGNYQSYVVPIVSELVTMVNEQFNPYILNLNRNELDIMVVDANGKVSSTTGKLEDPSVNNYRNSGGGSSSGSSNSSSSGSSSSSSGGNSDNSSSGSNVSSNSSGQGTENPDATPEQTDVPDGQGENSSGGTEVPAPPPPEPPAQEVAPAPAPVEPVSPPPPATT